MVGCDEDEAPLRDLVDLNTLLHVVSMALVCGRGVKSDVGAPPSPTGSRWCTRGTACKKARYGYKRAGWWWRQVAQKAQGAGQAAQRAQRRACQHAKHLLGELVAERDVIRLQLAHVGVLALREDHGGERLSDRRVGGVVDRGDAGAERDRECRLAVLDLEVVEDDGLEVARVLGGSLPQHGREGVMHKITPPSGKAYARLAEGSGRVVWQGVSVHPAT